jgi:hypothetical protein
MQKEGLDTFPKAMNPYNFSILRNFNIGMCSLILCSIIFLFIVPPVQATALMAALNFLFAAVILCVNLQAPRIDDIIRCPLCKSVHKESSIPKSCIIPYSALMFSSNTQCCITSHSKEQHLHYIYPCCNFIEEIRR